MAEHQGMGREPPTEEPFLPGQEWEETERERPLHPEEGHGEDDPVYIISVAARLVDMHPQTLRMYERLGLVQPQRSEHNIRLYSERDIERLRKIKRLTQDLGVNLAGVEIILDLLDRIEQLQRELQRRREEIRREVEREIMEQIRRWAGGTIQSK
jgi:MerR family transcriptional regulator/heat shock protein HspR